MNRERWFTKEDIRNDLHGLGGWGDAGFDEKCIIQGQKPPPPRQEFYDEDDEIRLRYGTTTVPFEERILPDLKGITEMLRMADNFDTLETEQDTVNDIPKNKKGELPPEKIVIHKLNPNVQEFVPKTNKNSQYVRKNMNSTNDTTDVSLTNKDDQKTVESVDNPVEKPNENSTVPLSSNGIKDTPEECVKPEKMNEKDITTAALKNTIIAASKINTPFHKRERNVAIAALLKLNSKPSSSPSIVTPPACSPKPVTLYTPDYFEGPRNTAKVLNIDDGEHSIPAIDESKGIDTPCTPKRTEVDPYRQESINKVNEWLKIPQEPKVVTPPVPYTGPVIFKKKDSLNSPLESQASGDTPPVEPSLPAAYVPSDYASELARKYEERSENMNEKRKAAPIDIWTKLENDLKARDQVIKEKQGVVGFPRISPRLRINNVSPRSTKGKR